MQKIRWGQARIELIPLIQDIYHLFESGHSKKRIYEKLRDENKISMSFETFKKFTLTKLKLKKIQYNKKSDNITNVSQIKKETPLIAETESTNKQLQEPVHKPKSFGTSEKKEFGSGTYDFMQDYVGNDD